jgi:hypothetical protein
MCTLTSDPAKEPARKMGKLPLRPVRACDLGSKQKQTAIERVEVEIVG